jgi:DNA-binding FrmR family transcriptional regulator
MVMAATAEMHQSFPGIVKRLKRADGHLRSIVGMIDDGRPCLELAQQLHAVEKAIAEAKKALIHDHIDHCLAQAARPGRRDNRGSLEEFKLITKYL